jgi:hypothetical protein
VEGDDPPRGRSLRPPKRVAQPGVGGVDPAYSARIYRPKDREPAPSPSNRASLSFHVSLLGPYYGIHDRGEPDEKPAVIAAEIEATYPGYRQIPPELGNELVPDVSMPTGLMGKATIYVCLFLNIWTWADPEPWRLGKGSIKHTQGEQAHPGRAAGHHLPLLSSRSVDGVREARDSGEERPPPDFFTKLLHRRRSGVVR